MSAGIADSMTRMGFPVRPDQAGDQIHWNLATQKEVILAPLKQPVRVVPHGEAGCPSTSRLDARLTWPAARRNPVRRNSDRESRARQRSAGADGDQETLDRVVADKIRSGAVLSLTLYELQQASLGLISADVFNAALSIGFDRLAAQDMPASFDFHDADVTMFTGDDDAIVVDVGTGALTERFRFPGPDQIPRIRFYVNESSIETDEHGGWEID